MPNMCSDTRRGSLRGNYRVKASFRTDRHYRKKGGSPGVRHVGKGDPKGCQQNEQKTSRKKTNCAGGGLQKRPRLPKRAHETTED